MVSKAGVITLNTSLTERYIYDNGIEHALPIVYWSRAMNYISNN